MTTSPSEADATANGTPAYDDHREASGLCEDFICTMVRTALERNNQRLLIPLADFLEAAADSKDRDLRNCTASLVCYARDCDYFASWSEEPVLPAPPAPPAPTTHQQKEDA